jgi:hypothetical protein
VYAKIQSACRKKAKRGISTVLGVLLMLGVLFSTIIPLFMYVNSVGSYYDTTVVNIGIADHERGMEDLTIHAFGRKESNDINALIINDGSMSVNITRIWVMSMDLQRTNIFTSQNVSAALNGHDLPLQLNPSDQATIENLTLTSWMILDDPDQPELDVFNIEVTTARGNLFPSDTNPLNYNGGIWGTGMNWPWLEVIVRSDESQDDFQIDVVATTRDWDDTISSEHALGDYFTIIPVFKTGEYNVTVTKTTQKNNPVELGTDILVVTEIYPIAMVMFIDPD